MADRSAGAFALVVASDAAIRLGLRANWRQFALLVAVNAFVGAMVGLERAILPVLGEQEFGVASRAALLTFIASFGATKALTNLAAGALADRVGRKQLLIAGWLIGLPVPVLIILAPTWEWVVAANLLLGVNQGLCWSMTVIMKVDLVGPARRGLALGINEFAGYLSVGLAAFAGSELAAATALRPQPFLLGLAIAILGLGLSLATRESVAHARAEARDRPSEARPSLRDIFLRTTWRDRALSAASQAGLVNNLNDGVAWGLLPLLFLASGRDLQQVGVLAGAYPAVWGVAQLATGAISDALGRRWLIVVGMFVQAAALGVLATSPDFWLGLAAMAALGLGTALVYPTLLAVISDVAHPQWRATATGAYRFWRDAGYVVGALVGGVVADRLGLNWAVGVVAAITLASGLVTLGRLPETRTFRGSAGVEHEVR
ncbi:MAG TPA: MFS transporter [Candidatus Limnocylindria bacterium]